MPPTPISQEQSGGGLMLLSLRGTPTARLGFAGCLVIGCRTSVWDRALHFRPIMSAKCKSSAAESAGEKGTGV